MTRKINNSYLLGQSNAPTTGGDMLKTRSDGTPVWEEVDGTTYKAVRFPWFGGRGVFGGGYAGGTSDVIDYITIDSTGNATDFGDISAPINSMGACSNGSRGLFVGGSTTNVIQYITISTTGDTTDFGDLTLARRSIDVCSDGTKGVFGGGSIAGVNPVNTIDYITVSTAGNATDFGDVTVARYDGDGCSDGTKGVFGGGYTDANVNIIDYVTIATTGNN